VNIKEKLEAAASAVTSNFRWLSRWF